MAAPLDLVVPNLGEFNLGRFSGEVSPREAIDFHKIGETYGDQGFLWSMRERVLVLPGEVDQGWLADLSGALGQPVPDVITPRPRTRALIGDLLADGQSMAALGRALGPPRSIRLLCWGASSEVYLLRAAVAALGHEVALEVPPQHSYWTVGYLDSKLSCLDLPTSLPGLRIPRTWTVGLRSELQGAVGHLLATAGQAFVKSPRGVGNEGIYHVSAWRPGGKPPSQADEGGLAGLWEELDASPFFRSYPLLVQEAVITGPGIDTLSVDFNVGQEQSREQESAVITSVTGEDGCQFMTLGRGAGLLPAALADEARETAGRVAAWAARLGYLGWLGIDFLTGRDGRLYLLELNARRTGGIHAAALLGRRPDCASAVACVADDMPVAGTGPVSYSEVRETFRAAWARGDEIYPSTVRGLGRSRPTIGIVAVGPDAGRARDLLGKFTRVLMGGRPTVPSDLAGPERRGQRGHLADSPVQVNSLLGQPLVHGVALCCHHPDPPRLLTDPLENVFPEVRAVRTIAVRIEQGVQPPPTVVKRHEPRLPRDRDGCQWHPPQRRHGQVGLPRCGAGRIPVHEADQLPPPHGVARRRIMVADHVAGLPGAAAEPDGVRWRHEGGRAVVESAQPAADLPQGWVGEHPARPGRRVAHGLAREKRQDLAPLVVAAEHARSACEPFVFKEAQQCVDRGCPRPGRPVYRAADAHRAERRPARERLLSWPVFGWQSRAHRSARTWRRSAGTLTPGVR